MAGGRDTGGARRPDYGIDAPGLVRFFFLSGVVAVVLCIVLNVAPDGWPHLLMAGQFITGLAALYLAGMGCLMLFWSKAVKLREHDRALDMIPWRGDEHVLDVGCGRGLMLIGAAKRLTAGRAVGIDIWQAKDQSSNSPQGVRENANYEDVSGKVDIQTADMRSLPFVDRSFDVVVSHWAVHNLTSEADRNLAISEMNRVLRPGGRLILCDIAHRDAYLARLEDLGMTECRIIVNPIADAILAAVSFGSFRPATIYARQPMIA